MEPVSLTLGAIVAAAVAKAQERIAGHAVDGGEGVIRRVLGWMRSRVADGDDAAAGEALELIEQARVSPERLETLADELDALWAGDARFRAQLRALVGTLAGEMSADRGRASANAVLLAVDGNVPAPIGHFAGRVSELHALARGWEMTGGRVRALAITGLGGVGKSQLAARFAEEHAHDYDVIAWIGAEDGGTADLAELAERLGEPVAKLAREDRAAMARRWLHDCQLRWLVIFDDVPSAASLPAEWRSCRPNGRILLTTRNREDVTAVVSEFPLDVLDEESAVSYLMTRAGREGEGEREDARRVAQALGGLPLALSHAAGYCESGTSFAEYLTLFETFPIQRLFAQRLTSAGEKAVATTWQVSMQTGRNACALTEPVLAMAAYMASDDIPKLLFEVLVDRGLGDRLELMTAFRELRRLSLASADGATISVHRVLQKTVRDEATSRDDQTAATLALEALVDAFPDTPSLPAVWLQCEALVAHVLAIADHLPRRVGDVARVMRMLECSCRYLLDSGQRTLAVQATARTAEIAAELCDEDDDAVELARTQHAAALQWAGRSVDALSLSESVVGECRRRWGDQHETTLAAKAQLAFSYQWGRRIEDAVSLGENVLHDRERLLGADHLDTLSARVELSWSYWLAERFDKGLETIEPALPEHERLLGDQHPATIFDRATIAVMQRELDLTNDAITGLERVLREREREFGEHHPDTLWTRANLAKALELRGDPHAAITMLRGTSPSDPGVVRGTAHVLGPEHQDSLCARAYLASALWATGATHEARRLVERVRADLRQSEGPWLPRIVVRSPELRAILAAP